MASFSDVRILAQAAFEAYELPEGCIIADADGFTSEVGGSEISLVRKVQFGTNDTESDEPLALGHFSISMDASTLDIADATMFLSGSGDVVGWFTEECRAAAYDAARIQDPKLNALVPA